MVPIGLLLPGQPCLILSVFPLPVEALQPSREGCVSLAALQCRQAVVGGFSDGSDGALQVFRAGRGWGDPSEILLRRVEGLAIRLRLGLPRR
jgi:hypothetical protein